MRCGRECDCESEEEHDAAVLEMEKDFLRAPGPPPARMSATSVSRAERAMAERRKTLGMEPAFGSFEWVKKAAGQ